MTTTLLSTILDRMKRWQAISTVEDQYLVRDLDESIRTLRREIVMPWNLRKTSLRVFDGVLEYPVASDHDELAFLDEISEPSVYSARPRFRFTSIKEFYENPDYRNDLAEIWDGGERYLGVRYSPAGNISQLLNNAETEGNYSASGDASDIDYQTVVRKYGNGSIQFTVTSSTGVANLIHTFSNSFTDTNYKQKYHFEWVYLDAIPTTIDMRFKIDDSNYLETTDIATQFSGQSLKANAWNLIAHDLNEATEVGTVATTSTWAQGEVILNGADSGTYYIDQSHLRQWSLMDYWYYSKYSVATVGETEPNQEYFFNSNEIYATDNLLVGDTEWVDVIQYDAMLLSLADKEVKDSLYNKILARRQKAWADLIDKYPSLEPVITTLRYRFSTDFNSENTRHD